MNNLIACGFAALTVFFCSFAIADQPATRQGIINLAAVAKPSASFVSDDTTLLALNDGSEPRNSRDNRHGSYGNWNRTGTQWVQYDWNQPISTQQIAVYWWADGRGIKAPLASRLLYWNGNAFAPVAHASGLGVKINGYNTTTFDQVRTTKLRLEIDSDGTFSTGILQWKVIDSGNSPRFPPRVEAGVDRVVILGGNTYLDGSIKLLQPDAPPRFAWSKESGPGEVTFDNAQAAATTAQFSAPGDYVLNLTAADGPLSDSSTLHVKVTESPPPAHLDPVHAANWSLDSRLWNGRVKALMVNWIPHCCEKLSELDLKEGGINNFIQAGNKLAGRPFERRLGPPWADAYVHNTVESMCIALMIDPRGDPELIAAQKAMRDKLEDWIPKILSAQEPDGYLQTRFTLSNNLPHWNPKTRGDHEGYTGGYFIEAALAHYRMTNKADARLYLAARKLADCWYDHIGPPPKQEWFDGHEEMELALVRLGEFVNHDEGAGRGQKYISLAKYLLDCRRGGTKYDQSHLPVIQQYEAEGHAVRAVYTYSGMTGVAMETGDIDYHSAVQSIWNNIVNKKYYITGGVGSGETSEGFGPNYSLRNNAYCESCSGCGELIFQHDMNLAYRDARYADLYEETLYNAILGDIDLDGKNFYYQNPLDSGTPRYLWHTCPCCVGNIPRVLLNLPTWMYAKSPDEIDVNLFIGSTVAIDDVAGTRVEMVQATNYPWSGKVSITVNPDLEKAFTVRVRVPNRNVSALYSATPPANGIDSLAVNGSPITPVIEKGYAVISRTWKTGDKIDLQLPMKVQRVTASDKITADRGRVALRYGPLIYNIEGVDQDVHQPLTADAPLTTEWRGDLLGGVTVIKGAFANGNAMLAIPNYARNNRAPAGSAKEAPASIVWIEQR